MDIETSYRPCRLRSTLHYMVFFIYNTFIEATYCLSTSKIASLELPHMNGFSLTPTHDIELVLVVLDL